MSEKYAYLLIEVHSVAVLTVIAALIALDKYRASAPSPACLALSAQPDCQLSSLPYETLVPRF